MENLQRNLGKHLNAPFFKNRLVKKNKQWTILLVDDHGKLISFSRFKEAVLISASIFFVAVIAAVILFFLYNNTQNDNKKLQTILSASQEKVRFLKNKNDILMAGLVISESKVNENSTKKQADKKPALADKKPALADKKPALADKKPVLADEKPALADEKPAIVSVDNFNVYYDKNNNILNIQYIIVKKTFFNEKIAGHTVAVLKNNVVNQNEWIVLPQSDLIKGKPSGKTGQRFIISNLKKVNFKITQIANPNQFNKATIFVFSKKGELLLEKDFPILIKGI